PHASDAAEKMTTPSRNIRLRPRMSPARPPSRRKPPNVIAYAVITHCRPVTEKWRLRPIDGSATLTIETSSTVMKKATQTRASACQRRGSCPAFSTRASVLVAEVSAPGEDHGGAGGRDSRGHLLVPARAARLDDRRDARLEAELRAVGEREERVGGEHRAAHVVAELRCLLDRDPDGVDAAHLAGADPDRREILRQDDRVRADVLADAPREDEVSPLRLVHLAGDDLPALPVLDVGVGVLDEHAAEHALVVALAGLAGTALAVEEDADHLAPLADRRERVVVVAGREDEVGGDGDLLGERQRHGAVEDDDAAVGGGRVGSERLRVGLLDRRPDRGAARVRVLDDHAGRQRELAGEEA